MAYGLDTGVKGTFSAEVRKFGVSGELTVPINLDSTSGPRQQLEASAGASVGIFEGQASIKSDGRGKDTSETKVTVGGGAAAFFGAGATYRSEPGAAPRVDSKAMETNNAKNVEIQGNRRCFGRLEAGCE